MSALLSTAFYLQGQDPWHINYCRIWFGDSIVDSGSKWQRYFNSVKFLLLKLGESNIHCNNSKMENISLCWTLQISRFSNDLWSCFFTFLTRLEDLRVKLENEGLANIWYMVVNHKGTYSQRKFHLLKESVSDHITVYQQDEKQADVWTTLNGNKDDFLIYDRSVFRGEHRKIFACI